MIGLLQKHLDAGTEVYIRGAHGLQFHGVPVYIGVPISRGSLVKFRTKDGALSMYSDDIVCIIKSTR